MTAALDKESITDQTYGDFLFLSIFHLLSEKVTGYSSFYFPRVKIMQGIKGNKSQMKAFQEEQSYSFPETPAHIQDVLAIKFNGYRWNFLMF